MTTKEELAIVGKNVGVLIREVRKLGESSGDVHEQFHEIKLETAVLPEMGRELARRGEQIDRMATEQRATSDAVKELTTRFDSKLEHLVTDGDLTDKVHTHEKECRADRKSDKRSKPPRARISLLSLPLWLRASLIIGAILAGGVAAWWGIPIPPLQ